MAIAITNAWWFQGGAAAYTSSPFSPSGTLDALENVQCTHLVGVPTMLHAVVSHPSLSERNLTALDMVITGGASTAPELFRACLDPRRARG